MSLSSGSNSSRESWIFPGTPLQPYSSNICSFASSFTYLGTWSRSERFLVKEQIYGSSLPVHVPQFLSSRQLVTFADVVEMGFASHQISHTLLALQQAVFLSRSRWTIRADVCYASSHTSPSRWSRTAWSLSNCDSSASVQPCDLRERPECSVRSASPYVFDRSYLTPLSCRHSSHSSRTDCFSFLFTLSTLYPLRHA